MKQIVYSFLFIALLLCSCHPSSPKSEITAEMAYEGVNNYCHSQFDWSIAEENPSIMYVTMGEETDSTYQVIFRSYTAAMTYFYVNKANGSTRMVEQVPVNSCSTVTSSRTLPCLSTNTTKGMAVKLNFCFR